MAGLCGCKLKGAAARIDARRTLEPRRCNFDAKQGETLEGKGEEPWKGKVTSISRASNKGHIPLAILHICCIAACAAQLPLQIRVDGEGPVVIVTLTVSIPRLARTSPQWTRVRKEETVRSTAVPFAPSADRHIDTDEHETRHASTRKSQTLGQPLTLPRKSPIDDDNQYTANTAANLLLARFAQSLLQPSHSHHSTHQEVASTPPAIPQTCATISPNFPVASSSSTHRPKVLAG